MESVVLSLIHEKRALSSRPVVQDFNLPRHGLRNDPFPGQPLFKHIDVGFVIDDHRQFL